MSITIGVYWGPRQRPLDELVSQAAAHFRVLAKADEGVARWAPMGRSLKQAMLSEPVDTSSPDVLRRFLLKGQNKTDMPPRQPIPELGYRLSLWNRRRGNLEASTSIHCGAHSQYLSEDSQNNALLDLRYLDERGLAVGVLLDVFRKTIDTWQPDWGTIWRYAHDGHPAGAPWDPKHVQYAFYQSRSGMGPAGRGIGQQQLLGSQGRLWINEAASPFMEKA
ncbi:MULTISPECIES: Imm52 family immunity protein [Mesorhizobium]|uniref:Imm52 family immunity protein n=1 Tax=Mesorhizobium TaxID=68287 RepID=UPI0010A96AB1|nr:MULTISPECIES: Imm52 family immunity protein [Mesorhizobium]